jgi:hypothetical protein
VQAVLRGRGSGAMQCRGEESPVVVLEAGLGVAGAGQSPAV